MSIGGMLKARASRHSYRSAPCSAGLGFPWVVIACLMWNWPATGAEEPVLSVVGGPNAAADLKAEARCDPVELRGIARLSWGSAESGGEQRVDVTMFRDGFQTGRFETFGPLPANRDEVALTTGEPGISYYWRVLTETGDGWAPSKIERLPWPICPTNGGPPLGETDLRPAPDSALENFEDSEALEDFEALGVLEGFEEPERTIEPEDTESTQDLHDFGALQNFERMTPDARGTRFDDVNPDRSNFPVLFGSGGRVNGLANVPRDNQTFYAASEWGGLYRTTDGGRTWEHLDDHLPAATWDVEVNPANPRIVYATSFYDGRVNSLAGINVSFDGGETWDHPSTATPPRRREGFTCAAVSRMEPIAWGISINPNSPDSVYIGFDCGLAVSRDRGRTWRFVDPEQFMNPDPTRPAAAIVDVIAHSDEQGNEVVDVCGNAGHFRSEDGGRTWRAGAGLAMGVCSIAVSPDESYVLIAVVGTTIYQSVNGGNIWVQNINNPRPQGRIPFVATNQRCLVRLPCPAHLTRFDLWFGDVFLHRFTCTTPPPPLRRPGGPPRCPANPDGVDVGRGAHVDVGDLAFNTTARINACPLIFSTDGGVYRNTLTRNPNCHNPIWMQPQVSPHALWLWTLAGAHQEGPIEEDVYFGTQDNGSWFTLSAGALEPPGSLDWVRQLPLTALVLSLHLRTSPTISTLARR
jgi:hypothetical protein